MFLNIFKFHSKKSSKGTLGFIDVLYEIIDMNTHNIFIQNMF